MQDFLSRLNRTMRRIAQVVFWGCLLLAVIIFAGAVKMAMNGYEEYDVFNMRIIYRVMPPVAALVVGGWAFRFVVRLIFRDKSQIIKPN